MSSDGPQRQRHGVRKNMVEGVGGVIVGAALVVMAVSLLKRRRAAPAPQPEPAGDTTADTQIPQATD
ncbi:carbon monoxide dehydrogenase [Thiohalocapsa marina]|uniref:carbon monoxide dehydrogenase n=1 Tax=Thiohalocapsa marina TaxID=424902 RepID=UPI001B85C3F1|nr:carbon monoxide dehydrogenase [Thiohalocapsa marina]